MDDTAFYFWWDGGFESVHNRKNQAINPDETAHVASKKYRLDLSRRKWGISGLEVFPAAEGLLGLRLLEPEIPLDMRVEAIINGVCYRADPKKDTQKSIMVYDSGCICHQLRMKGCGLYDKSGARLADAEFEIAFYCWNDLFTATLLLLDKNTRQPLRDANTEIRLCFNTRTAILRPMQNTAWLQCKQGGVLIHAMETLSVSKDEILFQSFGTALTTYWEPLKLPAETSFQAHQKNVFVRAQIGTNWVNGIYDPLSAGWIFPILNADESQIAIYAETDSKLPIALRLGLYREGQARLRPDGSVIGADLPDAVNAMGVCVYAENTEGLPSGTTWQISIDGHEFPDYPRPYTHRWIHLYARGCCSKEKPFCETVTVGRGKVKGIRAATFSQLSLLGWDDNPHYGNPLDRTAVQLWLQGLIGTQESLCICPESHMTDCTITDIRPIDTAHEWGPNNGGGDFLRYRIPQDQTVHKMLAARCEFLSYGPICSSVRYHMISDDGAIHGDIQSVIFSSNDLARVFFHADYTADTDITLKDLTAAWLGCPGYDRSRYAKYAWGKEEQVCEDALVDLCAGTTEAILPEPLRANMWFSAYRGGIIDEQFREPNGNKGMILRSYSISIKNHPHMMLQAKRLQIDVFDGITTQFWLGLYPEEDLHICAGDHLHITWEYVPTVKYATDISATEKAYYQLILDHPDSYCPIQMEAIHGKWSASAVTGSVVSQEPILRVALHVTGCTQTGMFRVRHGVGYFPIEVRFSEKPGKITLLCSRGNWKRVGNLPYQLHREDGSWIATFLMQIDSQNFSAPEESLITITANNNGS